MPPLRLGKILLCLIMNYMKELLLLQTLKSLCDYYETLQRDESVFYPESRKREIIQGERKTEL